MQIIPHPWKKQKNLRNKVYNTEEKRIIKVENRERQENWQTHSIPTNKYNPVNKDFWTVESNTEDDSEPVQHQEEAQDDLAEQDEEMQEDQVPEAVQDEQEVQEEDMVLLPPSPEEEEEIQLKEGPYEQPEADTTASEEEEEPAYETQPEKITCRSSKLTRWPARGEILVYFGIRQN